MQLLAEITRLRADVKRLRGQVTAMAALLEEALPHVEKMGEVLSTGPCRNDTERLADEIQAALATEPKS